MLCALVGVLSKCLYEMHGATMKMDILDVCVYKLQIMTTYVVSTT